MNTHHSIKHIDNEESRIDSKIETEFSHKKHTIHLTPMQLYKDKIVAVFIFVLLVITLSGLVWFKTSQQVQKTPTVKQMIINKQILQRRSKDLGFIQRGLTGKAVDVNTGKIVTAARIFSLNDKTVYLELDLNAPPKGTVIDYLRYKDGRYVDHGEVVIAKTDTKDLLFNWTINTLLAHIRDGKWKVATYTNGILAKRITYEVQNNKIGYVYPDETISPNDSDYHLTYVNSLIAQNN